MQGFVAGDGWELFTGDCRNIMLVCMADNSVDSVVCDPPYELGFMGKSWDNTGIAYDVAMWKEVLRVLKPGGHLLSFGGSRTYHRMACAIEDAGFEIRDQIMWVYGSGFPKSMDVSKAIDKAAGAEREVVGPSNRHAGASKASAPISDFSSHSNNLNVITAPSTPEAKQWNGWGTALKPAHEPIVMARKPLIGTVAANVLLHGTGALNIDASRVEHQSEADRASATPQGKVTSKSGALAGGMQNDNARQENTRPDTSQGRFPANLIHDGSDEVLAAFPDAKGQQGDLIGHSKTRSSPNGIFSDMPPAADAIKRVDSSPSAARFFYCAKTSKSDRNDGCDALPERTAAECVEREEGSAGMNNPRAGANRTSGATNNHPTVKPNSLMRYLVRMVTPPNGTVFDPFTGSGSTGKAAMQEGFKFVGTELSAEYAAIAAARIGSATSCA